jgi:hypothetical protein
MPAQRSGWCRPSGDIVGQLSPARATPQVTPNAVSLLRGTADINTGGFAADPSQRTAVGNTLVFKAVERCGAAWHQSLHGRLPL